MGCYVGVDVSSEWLDLAMVDRSLGRFANDEEGIARLIDRLPLGAHVVLEPTSVYHQWLVRGLRSAGVPYSVINPAHTAAFAKVQGKRSKTDAVDARLLATYGETQRPQPSFATDEAQERLKMLRRHREWLDGELQGVRNRLQTAERSPWTPRAVPESLRRMIRELEEEIERVDAELRAMVEAEPRWREAVALLMTIPSVGWVTSVLLISELPPVDRCESGKAWAAFIGVCPALHESGKRATSRLSRSGSPLVRSRLYMPSIVAMSHNPPVRALNERLREKGKAGKVRIMAAMNKLVRLCFGVLRSGRPFEPARSQIALGLD